MVSGVASLAMRARGIAFVGARPGAGQFLAALILWVTGHDVDAKEAHAFSLHRARLPDLRPIATDVPLRQRQVKNGVRSQICDLFVRHAGRGDDDQCGDVRRRARRDRCGHDAAPGC